MKNMKLIATIFALLVFAAINTGSVVQNDTTSPREAVDAKDERPLDALTFLTGTWQGEMNDGEFVEEIWSAPGTGSGDTMMGMFRWLNAEGQPRMYEMLTISREGDIVKSRVSHDQAAALALIPSANWTPAITS